MARCWKPTDSLLAATALLLAGLAAGASRVERIPTSEPTGRTGEDRDLSDGGGGHRLVPCEPVVLSPSVTVRSSPSRAATSRAATSGWPPGREPSGVLWGSLTHDGRAGPPGRIEFVAGPNRGRVLATDLDGRFRIDGLQPGCARVALWGARGERVERLVNMGPQGECELRVDFRLGPLVEGTVLDDLGRPLAGARVALDGNGTWTDSEGRFVLPSLAAGEAELVARCAGYAAAARRLTPSATDGPTRALSVRLRRGSRLVVALEPFADPGGDAQVVLVPGASRTLRGGAPFPWARLEPIRVRPGRSVTIEDLPPGEVWVRVFHACAKGRTTVARLSPGGTTRITVSMEPVPVVRGRVVTPEGRPLAGLRIALEADDPLSASASALGSNASILRVQPLEALPSARQETHSDADGAFSLGWWDAVGSDRRLVVTDGAGSHRARLAFGPDPPCAALELVVD